MINPTVVEKIARIAHQLNKAICEAGGDYSQVDWEDAPNWQRESSIKGVQYRMDNPDAPTSHQHDQWMEDKKHDGWVWGPEKDPEAKFHPCLVPFKELPFEQKVKDYVFVALVEAMR